MANETTKQPDAMEALQKQMAAMQQTIDLLMKSQSTPTPDTIWAKQEDRLQKIEEEQNRIATYISLPTVQRSQYEANRKFESGKKIFSVLLGTGKKGECPTLFIRADLESDAKSRYQEVCGIRHVVPNDAHPEFSRWTIADVTNDKAAVSAVAESWKYQPTQAA